MSLFEGPGVEAARSPSWFTGTPDGAEPLLMKSVSPVLFL